MTGRSAAIGGLIAILLGLNLYQYSEYESSELSNEEITANFQRIFIESKELFKNRWFGAKTLQNPFDVWITQEIIFEVQPDVIVETGTYNGGSAMLWATILEQLKPNSRIITVDIMDNRSKQTREFPISRRHVDFLKGSSTKPEIVSEITQRVRGKKVMVILDALHTKEHVLGELRAYAPLVNVGSYLIVQDTHLGDTTPFWYRPLNRRWQAGPRAAIEEFMSNDDHFIVDTDRERMMFTNNRGGYLKRVK